MLIARYGVTITVKCLAAKRGENHQRQYRLPEVLPVRFLRAFAPVVGDGCSAAGGMTPNLVTAVRLAIELKSQHCAICG